MEVLHLVNLVLTALHPAQAVVTNVDFTENCIIVEAPLWVVPLLLADEVIRRVVLVERNDRPHDVAIRR